MRDKFILALSALYKLCPLAGNSVPRFIKHQNISLSSKKLLSKSAMDFAYLRMAMFVLIALVVFTWFTGAEATYRKPPFNGSIFGKRGVTAEYDNANKALSALCEIAIDACQPWFPAQEK